MATRLTAWVSSMNAAPARPNTSPATAIRAKKFESRDPYGIPVIAMNDAMERQVQIGLGPLHTQFDSKPCVAYTSVYVDSQVARWNCA